MAEAIYESDELLNQYLLFHYGSREQIFPNAFSFPSLDAAVFDFPKRCVHEGVDTAQLPARARALDLGCAVGRSSFELAEIFDSVLGIDYSAAFIQAAERMRSEGTHPVSRMIEGGQSLAECVSFDKSLIASRVDFEVGDAMALRSDLGSFDCVLACNLICRLSDPMALLDRLSELVQPGGQLVITTPFTWLESFTPSDRWLSTESKDSFSGLTQALTRANQFTLDAVWDMPFLIREHARKFQFSIAQASRWIRSQI